MAVQTSLQQLRHIWVETISQELSTGEGVRAGFAEELQRFYTLLEQSIVTGDTAWLDKLLYEWGHSSTETNLEEADYHASFVINRMISLTINIASKNLEGTEALEFLAYVIPILAHSLSVVIRYEMETRVAHISKELGDVQEKLQTLDRNKSKFISVAAHELKTPLTLIEGYTSMMIDLGQESEQALMKNYLKGVNTGILRLRDIIDDMIDVSLIDNNLLTLNVQPMWLIHMLSLIRNEFKKPTQERKQTLQVRDFPGSEMLIYGDSERLYQAISNVVMNAIKYTPDKGSITVDGRLLPGFIEVTVKDSGIGISPENQSVIFDKFGQLGRTDLHSSGKTKFKGGGPGLGLSITRGIIEAHGGTIWVESEGYDEVKLSGSTFHILLPTRTEANNPVMLKFFGNPEQQKTETETSGKENTPTNDSPA
ncbi:MAG: HAMP domain-containing histidine kinase [Anaerolineales bacterium]|nr:HAMP domain-containing histidine kinase [Anaerolineales bacterium]MCB9145788.1 HAMP domain-containing histidine kinase [Anaerolineales bacterium]